jgi:hypothetical protein
MPFAVDRRLRKMLRIILWIIAMLFGWILVKAAREK